MDFTGHWQPGSVFRAMQEVAGAQCAGYGLSYSDMSQNGLAWVLTRACVRMDRYPVYGEPVEILTWPTASRHTFFPRHFAFMAGGEQVGLATALYVVFDLNERKIAPSSRLPHEVPVCERPAPLPMPGAVRRLDAPSENAVYTPAYHDADMNGHVNNTRYVDWFCDRFACAKHRKQELCELLVNYNLETRPDEPLTLALQSEGNISVMHGLRDGASCFAIEGKGEDRK